MTKFLNDPANAVAESLRGLARCHADLIELSEEPRFVARRNLVPGKVALISGGGSGHEPLHTGFVGRGMLDAAVPGEVFSSPSVEQILAAGDAVGGDAGLLCLIKNYSGDIMNFELAMEMFGRPHATVVIEDDIGAAGGGATVGRRGVAGTLVVEKIAGAAAERMAPLDRCAELAREVAGATRTMGVALGACRVPTADKPNLDLAPGEMEIGIGIHGEPGRRRVPIAPADDIVAELVYTLLSDLNPAPGESLLLFVNGLGGTPAMELNILYRTAARMLEGRGLSVARSLVGPYVTSLEMPGASITLTRMSDRFLELWDDPVVTPGLRWGA
jgi:dihydroxyacetone kinase-like protein